MGALQGPKYRYPGGSAAQTIFQSCLPQSEPLVRSGAPLPPSYVQSQSQTQTTDACAHLPSSCHGGAYSSSVHSQSLALSRLAPAPPPLGTPIGHHYRLRKGRWSRTTAIHVAGYRGSQRCSLAIAAIPCHSAYSSRDVCAHVKGPGYTPE